MFKTKDENLAKNEMEKEERRKNKLNTFDVLQEDKIRRQKKNITMSCEPINDSSFLQHKLMVSTAIFSTSVSKKIEQKFPVQSAFIVFFEQKTCGDHNCSNIDRYMCVHVYSVCASSSVYTCLYLGFHLG